MFHKIAIATIRVLLHNVIKLIKTKNTKGKKTEIGPRRKIPVI